MSPCLLPGNITCSLGGSSPTLLLQESASCTELGTAIISGAVAYFGSAPSHIPQPEVFQGWSHLGLGDTLVSSLLVFPTQALSLMFMP